MRYDISGPEPECTQIGPDMTFDPTFSVRQVPTGLVFTYQLGGINTLEVNLICLEVHASLPQYTIYLCLPFSDSQTVLVRA